MYFIPKCTHFLKQWKKKHAPCWLKSWVGRRRRSVCLLTLWIVFFALSFSGPSIWLVSKSLPVCLYLISLARLSPLIAADNWANSLSPFIIVLATFEIASYFGTLCEDCRHTDVAWSWPWQMNWRCARQIKFHFPCWWTKRSCRTNISSFVSLQLKEAHSADLYR